MLDFAKLVAKPVSILEIGSGTGRDCVFLNQNGYATTASDASLGFLELLKKNGITNPLKINIVDDALPEGYNAILANAVLLHLERPEVSSVLKKIFNYLPNSGVFGFSLKLGKGEEIITDKVGRERFFCYWNSDTQDSENIVTLLEKIGFCNIHVATNQAIKPLGKSQGWLLITVQKR